MNGISVNIDGKRGFCVNRAKHKRASGGGGKREKEKGENSKRRREIKKENIKNTKINKKGKRKLIVADVKEE